MARITCVTRSPESVPAYLGFGARIAERGINKFNDDVFIIFVPDEHADWQHNRLCSGMHGSRIVPDNEFQQWKSEWGYESACEAVARIRADAVGTCHPTEEQLDEWDRQLSRLSRCFLGDTTDPASIAQDRISQIHPR